MWLKHLFRGGVAAAGITAALAVSTAAFATGSSSTTTPVPGLPAGFQTWAAVFAAQNPLNDAGFEIQSAADANPSSGYTNFSMDIETRTLTVYWKGKPSPAESAVINAVRGRGIAVTLVAAKHSRRDLRAMTASIERDAGVLSAPRILRITTATDGSGIKIGVSMPAGSTRPAQVLGAATVSTHLPNLAKVMAGGDVSVVTQVSATSEYLREYDVAPFWGGALLMASGNTSACSTGFAANWPAIGKNYIITAAHCGAVGSTWYSGGGVLEGTAEGHTTAYDALFINTTPHGGSQGRVYDGPGIYQSGQFSKPVHGAAHVGVNGWVCLSGSFTGAVCNTQVTSTTDSDCSDPSLGCVNLIDAVSRSNSIIAGQGDSGGPVFTLSGDNTADYAVGLVHGPIPGDGTTTCSDPLYGHFPGFGTTRVCSSNVSFTDVIDAMAPFNGLTISTN
jgi:hypothetical protein